jgi:hypothetical protein
MLHYSRSSNGILSCLSSKLVHMRFIHWTTRGRLYCMLVRVASILMLCGLTQNHFFQFFPKFLKSFCNS